MQKKALWTKLQGAVVTKRKPRKPVRRVSPKQKLLLDRYAKLRSDFLCRVTSCEICTDEWMAGVRNDVCAASQVHHKRGRGKFLLDTDTWMGLCVQHHDAVHRNPRWAMKQGYMLPR